MVIFLVVVGVVGPSAIRERERKREEGKIRWAILRRKVDLCYLVFQGRPLSNKSFHTIIGLLFQQFERAIG